MNKNIASWSIAGFTLTVTIGTLLHFLYDFTNQSIFTAPFSAVNESTWEHMKLFYFPAIIFSLAQSRFFKGSKNFWCINAIGILTGLLLIPILFYTYNGAFGTSPDWLNITFFLIAAGVAFLIESYLFRNDIPNCKRPWLACFVIILIGILFAIFTFAPPAIPLFKDAVTGIYGK